MAKRVFFSFHYDDVKNFRANVVRKHWVTKEHREEAGFFDASLWEKAKKTGSTALKRMINQGLTNTSVTCVLIGSGTYNRPWVRYELLKSLKEGKSILGVHINSIKGKDGNIKTKGKNPLDYVGYYISENGTRLTMCEKKNGTWYEYTEIDSSASYTITRAAVKDRDRIFALSDVYPTYDWISNDGYNNFKKWVG